MVEEITLKVNGQLQTLSVETETPLVYILRNDLGLKGAKVGCGLEQCGSCKVLVDGAAVPSCRLPVKNVQGLEITTIEGLGAAGRLHPLQEAFVEEQAIQCGFCTPGMIIAAQGLLNRRRHPSDGEIWAALADNLCRCGSHGRALRAVKRRIGRPVMSSIHTLITADLRPGFTTPPDELPGPLLQTPDLDAWIRINRDGTITVFSGKVEFGQGIRTALAQIAADELDVELARIRMVMADTAETPDEGLTVSSMSLESSGNAIRYAAAEARRRLLMIAYEELEAPIDRLVVTGGVITDPSSGRSTTYWDLFGGKRFACRITGTVQPKRPEDYRIVGQAVTRLDLQAKVSGEPCFVHDLDLPGMVHGRVVRPPGYSAILLSAPVDAAAHMPGVLKVVRNGSFLALIAKREEQAVDAMQFLQENAVWQNDTDLPDQETLFEWMLAQPARPGLIRDGVVVDDPLPAADIVAEAAQSLSAAYTRPYQMHASLGPSAAVALWSEGELTIWSHSQGVFPPRAAIAHVLGLAPEAIHYIHREGPGCYGHNGADDAALDAALLAQVLPGKPVSLKWMRADEHAWEPYGPAMVVQMQAGLSPEGRVVEWHHDVWSSPHLGRSRSGPGVSGLLASWYLNEPFSRPEPVTVRFAHAGSHRNADPLYDFPRRRIVKHDLPESPLRVSSLRGLGAYANVFAIESFMDELAHAAGVDPLLFRLNHLADERACAVIEAAAEKANWQTGRLPGNGRGQGLAFARYKNRQAYAAVIVDVEVDLDGGQIHLLRAVIAADAGQIVNPDGLSNQLEGGFVQSASWTLKEEVVFDRKSIQSVDWESYPILRFPEAPLIETLLIDRPGQPFLGSGEAAQGPAPAAIANAVFHAAGIRLRQIPFTPGRVKSALAAFKPAPSG